ncbi:hypothetical protein AQ883_14770 [Burkholderia pseudomallei]|nr:hypothetical protein D512_17321 [Burkholderia pseudomallei MSHR1043]OMZ46170.1 hypothetical protein AQ864_10050 [Burkholderia pseudomallei]OMZ52780.1 hypothetical protein AQ863_24745 [Burkholderia pseudomallei]OMZ61039.1 hypothetical protein AQ866_10385 [Burkholderia pseudomallei]OMZ70616.1 hypothetical protein AQ867_29520 [Burkholderia pseudomallei]
MAETWPNQQAESLGRIISLNGGHRAGEHRRGRTRRADPRGERRTASNQRHRINRIESTAADGARHRVPRRRGMRRAALSDAR